MNVGNVLDKSAESNWHIAILIPARNEERLLPSCLESVAAAQALLPVEVRSKVIVVSDGSTDRTVDLAYNILRSNGVVIKAAASNVGSAQAIAARVALQSHRAQLDRCWLANTDADCEVPPLWLLDHLRIAEAGYAAVAGVVDVQDFSEHLPIVKERFRQTYRVEPDGTHPHVHGANLGVRADAYLAAGGWNELPTGGL